jgi:hypothetical protein
MACKLAKEMGTEFWRPTAIFPNRPKPRADIIIRLAYFDTSTVQLFTISFSLYTSQWVVSVVKSLKKTISLVLAASLAPRRP